MWPLFAFPFRRPVRSVFWLCLRGPFLAFALVVGPVVAQTHDLPTAPLESIASPPRAETPAAVRQVFSAAARRSIDVAPASDDLQRTARAAARSRAPGVPLIVGFGRDLPALASAAATAAHLDWQPKPRGGHVASLTVNVQAAAGFRLGVLVEALPRTAVFRFFGGEEDPGVEVPAADVLDAISRNTEAGNASASARLYWSPYFESASITLEIDLAPGDDPAGVLISIPKISQTTGKLFSEPFSGMAVTDGCEVDATCRPEWDVESLATAKISFVGESGTPYVCSGTLLNNAARNFVPYFLTANHCISNQLLASTIDVWWFYRMASCGSTTLDSRWRRTFGGAKLLYASATTDTSLVLLNQAPPGGTYFAGWNPNPQAPGTAVVGLHHPNGDPQQVSTGSVTGFRDCTELNAANLFNCAGSTASAGEYLAVARRTGSWQGGSSGSGLFVDIGGSHYLIGQLYGGPSSCTADKVFGRFDIAYQAAVSRWLQPSTATTLSVSKSGEGTVVSLPTGLNCGSSCSWPYDPGATVTLAASAKPGYQFAGWAGACSGTSPLCQVTLSASQSVTARFTPVASAGTGLLGTPVDGTTVSGVGVISGYHCSSKNLEVFIDGVSAGKAGAGTRLLGTQEVCGRTDTGYSILYNFNNLSNGLHVVHVTADGVQLDSHVVTTYQSGGQPWLAGASRRVTVPNFPTTGVTATLDWVQSYQNFLISKLDDGSGPFLPPYNSSTRQLTVVVSGGQGRIAVDDYGTCTTGCAANILYGSNVALAASAAPGYVFTGWTGNCIANGPLCTVPMNADMYIVANFAPVAPAGTGLLGTPVDLSTVSGVGVISGYHCSSKDIDVYIDGTWAGKAGAGTRLLGTQGVCGRTDTGYSILYNFNNLTNGMHVITVSADGIPLDSHTVWTFRSGGIPWLTNVSRTITVPDFPTAGRTAILEWVQSYQNFLITGSQ